MDPLAEQVGLLGRSEELAELTGALEAAAAGRGQFVLVTGEAGIGKTRLADELVTRAVERGVRVVWGRCSEAGGAPAFWPWIQALRALARLTDLPALAARADPTGAELGPLLGLAASLPADPPETFGEHDRFRLFDALVRLLSEVAAGGPLLITLDDLHAADGASLRLLQFLTRELPHLPILVVGTLREPGGPVSGELAKLLAAIRRESLRLPLSGLDEQDVARLIAARIGTQVAPSLPAMVRATTNGNPFFVDEIVRLLASEQQHGDPNLDRVLRHGPPSQLREVIWHRLDPLPEPVLQILSVAAVLGREFDLDLLALVAGADPDSVLDLLAPAVAVGILAEPEHQKGRWTFGHGLIREALYHELSTAQRIRLHRKAGQSLESRSPDEPDARVPQLAHHFLQAAAGGEAAKAFDYAWRAGDAARAVLAFEEAAAQYANALSLADAARIIRAQRTELLLNLASAQSRGGAFEDSESTWREAAGLARQTGDADQLARAAIGYALSGMLFGVTDSLRVALLEEALAAQRGSATAARARLLARLAAELYWSNERERSKRLSEEAVEVARELGDPAVQAYTLQAQHYAQRGPDTLHARIELAHRIIALAETAGDTELLLNGRAALITDLLELGDLARMDAELDALARAAGHLHHPAFRWYSAVYRMVRALLDGRFDEADTLADEATGAGRRAPEFGNGLFFAQMLTDLREDHTGAGVQTARLEDMAERYPGVFLWRALLAAQKGRSGHVEVARAELLQLTGILEGEERGAHWMVGCVLLAEVAAAVGDTARAGWLAAQLGPYAGRLAVAGRVAACRGAVDHALGLLARTVGDVDAAVTHLQDAAAIHRRMGLRPHLARSLIALGEALLSRRRPADEVAGLAALEEGRALAELLGLAALAEESRAARSAAADTSRPAWRAQCALEGEYWSIGDEQSVVRLKDVRGLGYLAAMLAQPGVPIHVLDLLAPAGAASGRAIDRGVLASRVGGDAGAVLDEQARTAYRLRLTQLQSERRQAETLRDTAAVARTAAETLALERALAAGVGLGGRHRLAASDTERARINVRKALTVALDRIAAAHPSVGEHLRASVRTGTLCQYDPDPRAPVDWTLA